MKERASEECTAFMVESVAKKKNKGRPKKGKETMISTGIRLEPSSRKKIIDKYGSVQKWIDAVVLLEE